MDFIHLRGCSRLIPVCGFLLVLALVPGAVQAQDFRGAIGGRVTDGSGAVLPGVPITVPADLDVESGDAHLPLRLRLPHLSHQSGARRPLSRSIPVQPRQLCARTARQFLVAARTFRLDRSVGAPSYS